MKKYLIALYRLSKLRIAFAITIEALVSMALIRRELPFWADVIKLFLTLTFATVGAGLANNLLDEPYDIAMERTSYRKEAIDLIGKKKLWTLSIVLSLLSFFLAGYFFSAVVLFLIVLAFLSYLFWYTLFLKRKSPFGAILGGLPGALPVLIGSYAQSSRFALDIWLFFLFMMLWQPPHFWALALYRKVDYELAKIPTLPVTFGEEYTKLFIYLYGFSLLPITLMMGYFGGYSKRYFALALSLGVYYLYQTIRTVEQKKYKKAFQVSLIYLLSIMASLLMEVAV